LHVLIGKLNKAHKGRKGKKYRHYYSNNEECSFETPSGVESRTEVVASAKGTSDLRPGSL